MSTHKQTKKHTNTYKHAHTHTHMYIYIYAYIYTVYIYIYIVSEFVFQSRYYVHFRANTLGKGMNPLILPDMG